MNRALVLSLLLFSSLSLHAMQPATGWCEQGGYVVTTGNKPSSTKVQRSFPLCTITVYLAGTATLATIYSDNSSTPLANPFLASATGQWTFYAADAAYDVQRSGASIAVPFKTPYTLVSAGGGGGGGSGFDAITSGTNTTATMIVGAGASLTRTSTGIIDANKILGTTLTSLTGMVYMTAGIPSVATGTCNSSTVVFGDGHCASALTSAFYQTVQLATVAQTQRAALNFSSNFTATDNTARTTIELAANIGVNAATATAFASNPTDCPANQFANAIAANGNLTCAQLAASNLSNGTTGSGVVVLASSPTILLPTIASFANAQHSHLNAAGGGTLDAAAIASGILATARLGSGTANSGTFLRGDSAWVALPGSGTVNVVGSGSLCSTCLVTGGGTTFVQTPSSTATMDGSGNISTPGSVTTGAGGGNAGAVDLSSGSANTAVGVGFQAPASISSPFLFTLPAAPAAGLFQATNATPSVISIVSSPTIATITNIGTETLPSTTGGLPIVIACGATTGSTNCANTNVGATAKIYFGSATLASNTATITISPGYTSTSTFYCVGNDTTTRANPVQVVPASATTLTITNTTGAADVISWHCVGY